MLTTQNAGANFEVINPGAQTDNGKVFAYLTTNKANEQGIAAIQVAIARLLPTVAKLNKKGHS